MAALDLEEQEQLAELKAWWNRYGNLLLTAITLVFLVIAGINLWNYYQRSQSSAAAMVFEGLQKLAVGGDAKKIGEASKALAEQYPRSAYASLGNLVAARESFEANDLPAARSQLQWVIDHARDSEYKHLATVRLAGVLLDQKEFDAALKVLAEPPPAEFEAIYADRKGDILFAQGKMEEARSAWQAALAKTGAASTLKAAIEFKLDLAGAPQTPTKS